ncbi:hypothetical protein NHX12_018017 [Muraenolepis orangiensis]|uniref:Protein FAM184B n=1 Tax=Muraenolepis orangiensis TaxID=630683 RepID=A0A9Q0EVZ9_9TELE|nr:hypothetical protein NHX12_018017 [Muraenolepis orangiensis]
MKNEEQESALQTLTYAHQEELHRIVMETCHEGEGSVLRTRLLELQESLDQQQRVGAQMQADFECFRAQREERERETEVELRKEFAEKLQTAEEELQSARTQLGSAHDESLRLGQELQKAGEQLRELETKYDQLHRAEGERKSEEEEEGEEKVNAQEERRKEEREEQERLHALVEEVRALKEEKERAGEEKRNAVREEKEGWERKVNALNEESDQARRRIEAERREERRKWEERDEEEKKGMHSALRERVKRAEAEVEDLEEELELGRRRVSEAEGGAKRAEEELAVAKERLLLQEDELQSRAEELLSRGGCEVCVCAELDELKNQLSRLQSRNRELELQSSGKKSDQARQIRQHAEALASLRSEMVRAQTEELRRDRDEEKQALRKEAEERKERLRRDTEEEAERLRMETEVERVRVRSQLDGHREQLERLKEQVRRAIEEVMRRHAAELQSIQEALSSERKTNQEVCLQDATNETRRLESVIKEYENKRRGTEETPPTCGPQCSRLKEELQQAQSRLARVKEDGEKHRERQQTELGSLRADRHRLEEKVLEHSRLNTERSLLEKSQRKTEEIRAECEERLRAEFRIELNAAVAEGEQRWQGREEELQTQVEELRGQIAHPQSPQAEKKRAGLGDDCHGNPEIDRLRKEGPHTQSLAEERHGHAMSLQALERQAQEDLQQAAGRLDESGCLVLELQRENATLREQLKERSILEKSETEEKEKEKAETLKHRDHRKELQSLASEYSSAQTQLQARIAALETELREREDRCRKRESRFDELQLGRLQERLTERDELIKQLVDERHQLQLHPPVAGDNGRDNLWLRDNKPRPGSITPNMGRKHPEEPPPRLNSGGGGSGGGSGTAVSFNRHSPLSLGHPSSPSLPRSARSRSSCTPPTPAPTAPLPVCPSPQMGIRYVKPSSRETHSHPTQGQPVRGSYLENRGSGTEGLKQEWYTKYFSF